jgi:two-component system sensor histidine kinase and response regulator WspE
VLVSAHRVLECEGKPPDHEPISVIILGEGQTLYGLVVQQFIGERELVMQPLDARLGKLRDVAAASLMEDGSPVLILDVEDLVRSAERASSGMFLKSTGAPARRLIEKARKRVLAVDDSLTVRELERKLLTGHGFDVDVAVDGMDGWNALRTQPFDLAIVDVDMPRLDGIELIQLIRKDSRLKDLPVMIVSYKDREEDRLRGLQAGADHFLTKACFQDNTLIQSVIDLIGSPDE